MTKKTKYQPLADFLMESNKEDITMTFTEIEKILGFKLSPSARKYRPNWANNSQEVLSWGWMPVGYESYAIDMKNEIVHFRKVGIANANYSKKTSIRQTATRKLKLVLQMVLSLQMNLLRKLIDKLKRLTIMEKKMI